AAAARSGVGGRPRAAAAATGGDEGIDGSGGSAAGSEGERLGTIMAGALMAPPSSTAASPRDPDALDAAPSVGAPRTPGRPARYALLRIATVVGPLAFLALLDTVRHAYFSATLHTLPGTVLIGVVLLVA